MYNIRTCTVVYTLEGVEFLASLVPGRVVKICGSPRTINWGAGFGGFLPDNRGWGVGSGGSSLGMRWWVRVGGFFHWE